MQVLSENSVAKYALKSSLADTRWETYKAIHAAALRKEPVEWAAHRWDSGLLALMIQARYHHQGSEAALALWQEGEEQGVPLGPEDRNTLKAWAKQSSAQAFLDRLTSPSHGQP